MPQPPLQIQVPVTLSEPFGARLKTLWADMDAAYTAAAVHYGFECRGCVENCCRTRFYHHTLLEYLYLLEGYQSLRPDQQRDLQDRARMVSDYQNRPDRDLRHGNHMCPLNTEGRCRLYAYRPMICRLHGIPHKLFTLGGQEVRGPGCDQFQQRCQDRPTMEIDRTPFYTRMALLEKELRQATGYFSKIKLTVAEMICSFVEQDLPS